MQEEGRFCWDLSRASGSAERVRVDVDGAEADVLPLWVAVRQDRATGLARCGPSFRVWVTRRRTSCRCGWSAPGTRHQAGAVRA